MSPDNAWIGTHTSPSTVAGGHSCSHPLIYAPTLQSKPAMRTSARGRKLIQTFAQKWPYRATPRPP